MLVSRDTVAGHDRLRAEPFEGGTVQHHLEFAAVHRILRPAATSFDSSRFGPDVGAVPAHECHLAGVDADRRQLVRQTEVVQLAHGVRLEVDTETERPQLGRRLVDPDGNADLVTRQGHRESGNPTAGDQQLHVPRVPVGRFGGETVPHPTRAARSGNSAGVTHGV